MRAVATRRLVLRLAGGAGAPGEAGAEEAEGDSDYGERGDAGGDCVIPAIGRRRRGGGLPSR